MHPTKMVSHFMPRTKKVDLEKVLVSLDNGLPKVWKLI